MNHIDENIIEQYVLGSGFSEGKKEEIEAHFAECHGCRTLASQIREFYRIAEEEFGGPLLSGQDAGTAIVRSRREIEPYFDPVTPPPSHYHPPITFVGKTQYYIRKHPVLAGTASFATLALIASAFVFGLKDFGKDVNPSYVHLDPQRAIVQIYNKNNEPLWNFPSRSVYNPTAETFVALAKRVLVADLNGDRKNEVITTLPVGDVREPATPLTIFSTNGQTAHRVQFYESVEFRGAKYPSEFSPSDVVYGRFDESGEMQLLVMVDNARSPNILYRLDRNGNMMGEYFHYGVGRIYILDLDNDSMNEVAFCGQNDIDDRDSLSYAVLIILDPSRITGKMEASDSRGFGVPVSTAERYVVRFPMTDMNALLHAPAYVSDFESITFDSQPAFRVTVTGHYLLDGVDNRAPIFEFILKRDMSVAAVKYDMVTIQLRQNLIDDGKVTGAIDDAYLQVLKNEVRYWDGERWTKEVSRVRSSAGITSAGN